MARQKLHAAAREIHGKQVKQIRSEGKIPAVLFGPKRESLNVLVDKKELVSVFKIAGYSSIIDFQMEGDDKPMQVIVKEIQRNPVTQDLYHVSLYEVDKDRPLTAEIPIHLIGESEAVKKNLGFLSTPVKSILIHCLPADLPSHIDIDISVLNDIGDTITVADLKLPNGVELDSSEQPSNALASIQAPQKKLEVEEGAAAPAEGEAAAPAAEKTEDKQ
jgi:large subunit ribosomal protein L25